MKSLEELKKIKDKTKKKTNTEKDTSLTRILVGMSTCGISAGAKPVFDEFNTLIKDKELKDISVTSVGCLGECSIEPMVEVYQNDKRYTYCEVNKEKAQKIFDEHIVNGNVVEDYLIGQYRK
ncbi:MAG: (2Fe-2S) ferredoxin domain-containing protein [Candidatus Izimaplasma sp.]|nr:(2Fe-2S) ferredoxin domain-containing protein [Candidatus Izimaplasma bacterium]